MRGRNQVFVVVALAVAALASGCTTGESYAAANYNFAALDRVAVVEVQLPIGGEAARDQIADVFAMELLRKGYQAVERRQVSAILKEQQFQAGDLTAPEDAARAGRILNIPAVIVVNIPTWGEKIDMTAKMIDVETGAIIWLGSGKGGTGKGLRTALGAAIGAAAGAVIGGDEAVAGAVIGGVAGGVAGYMLSPSEIEAVKKLAKKICETLPPRVGAS